MVDRRRDNLLRIHEVLERVPFKRGTLYRLMKAGRFPASIRVSEGLVAWYQSDIDAWNAAPMEWRPTVPANDAEEEQ